MSIQVLIGALVLVILLGGYYRISTISYANYRPQVSSLYCALAKSRNIPDYPVIFVPGLKGSQLEKDGKVVWLKTRQLFQQVVDSPLVLEGGDGISATGVFTRIVTIPFFLEYRGYHRISADMACAPHGYTFYYDWRKGPQEILPELDRLVDRVYVETGKRPALISHSYGALLTRGYVQDNHEKVGPVALVSGPFDPGPGFLAEDLIDGAPVFANKTLLSAKVNATHDSSYHLIPSPDSEVYMGKDVHDAKVWKEDGIGPYVDDVDYPLEAVQQKLNESAVFFEKTREVLEGDNQVMVVRNDSLETLDYIDTTGRMIYDVGDGRVGFESAMPFGIKEDAIKEYRHPARHSQQTQSREILKEVYQFIRSSVN